MVCSQVTCFRWFAIPAMAGHLCRISVAALAIFGRAMVKGHHALPKFRWCNTEEAKNDKCYVVAGWIDFFHYANFVFACLKGTHTYQIWQTHVLISVQKPASYITGTYAICIYIKRVDIFRWIPILKYKKTWENTEWVIELRKIHCIWTRNCEAVFSALLPAGTHWEPGIVRRKLIEKYCLDSL